MGGTVMKDLGKRVGIVICLFFLGLMTLPSPGEATPMPSPGNNYGDMRSALKFLQDMDSYYGQIARPRSKKDDCPDDMECDPGWSRFILLQGNDDSVSRLSRPRFGKRSEVSASDQRQSDIKAFMRLQGADYSVSRLSRPRFGKRSDGTDQKQSDMEAFMRLQGADDSVSRLSRPRCGKRSEVSAADQRQSDIEAFMRLQGADDSVSRLSRPRFGKRSDSTDQKQSDMEAFMRLQGAD